MPTLDGLRGVAILAVIWHNAGLTWSYADGPLGYGLFRLGANLGWMGVQLFFVLSGFLITGLLLDSKGRPQQLRHFYMRRVLRIFPLYFTVLLIAFALLPALGLAPHWLDRDRAQQLAYWTFTSNWVAPWLGTGTAFGHFWSLAVEEQFYLLWPLLVVAVSRDGLARCCLALIGSALLLRAWLIWHDRQFAELAAYQFTVVRWDALAMGALLALALRRSEWFAWLDRHWLNLLAPVLMYIVLHIAVEHNFAAVGDGVAVLNQSVAALLFSLMLFGALRPAAAGDSPLQRALQWPQLCAVGKYSYAIYVFHLPVIHIWGGAPIWLRGSPLLESICNVAVVFALSTALAVVSWHSLEQPFLRLKRFFAGAATAPKPVAESGA
jgi:peptidoglycan/LPS O-acetylase OafA/YrhL